MWIQLLFEFVSIYLLVVEHWNINQLIYAFPKLSRNLFKLVLTTQALMKISTHITPIKGNCIKNCQVFVWLLLKIIITKQ